MNGVCVKRILLACLALLLALLACAGVSYAVFSSPDGEDSALSPRNYDPETGAFAPASSAKNDGINFASGDPSLLDHSEVVNVVIFICYKGETPSAVFSPRTVEMLENQFNGNNVSLFDYYRTLSYGAFSVRSVFPATNGYAYVYQAPQDRSYYARITDEKGTKRKTEESKLLNGAVSAAASYFNLTGVNLDANEDGKVDSVSFVMSGAYEGWGELLWPHAWNLTTISRESSPAATAATIAGLTVDSYTMTFAGAFQIGLIAHEFGHLVGLPDLYHTEYDKNYLPVGSWDLMHLNGNVPQFTLSYLRGEGYLQFLDKKQVPELTVGGTYSLKPTVRATRADVIAYKVTVSRTESVWLEYRLADSSTYDREVPASGLIVYRVNSSAEGNTDARHQRASAPDEVYVLRHAASVYPSDKKETKEKENYDLSRAALSTTGAYASLGKKTTEKSYDRDCIYLSNGANTGIVVTVTRQTDDLITFTIDLGEYDCSDVSDSYVVGEDLNGKTVKNEHHVYYGMEPEVSVFLKYKNRQDAVELFDFSVEYDRSITNGSQTAYVVFTDVYGERRLPFTLYVYDVAVVEAQVVTRPTNTTLRVGETLYLDGLSVSVRYLSGTVRTVAYDPAEAGSWQIVEGLNVNVHGTYDHVKILYGDVAYCILSGVKVESPLVSLRVDERNTRHLAGDRFTPKFTVYGTYVDGSEELLSPAAYDAAYLRDVYFERTRVTLTAKENENATATSYVVNVKNESVSSLSLTSPADCTVNYGGEPDFAGVGISVSFSNGYRLPDGEELPLENYAADLMKNYSPTKTGVQTLTGSLDTATFSLRVTVTPRASDTIVAADGISVDENANVVTLKKPMTLGELTQAISPQSNLTLVFRDAAEDYDLTDGAFDSRPVGTNAVVLSVRTVGGIEIKRFVVFLLGDANGDGAADEKDVDFWLDALLSGRDRAYPYLDANGDGKYTLTDFVILLGGIR